LITSHTTTQPTGPRLFTRAEALAILKIGETTLHWLQRTGKLKPIRIGSRVLFNTNDIERVAVHGATLTEAEKEGAAKRKAKVPARQRDHRAGAREASRPKGSTA
jgi:helix-turn-helix protein